MAVSRGFSVVFSCSLALCVAGCFGGGGGGNGSGSISSSPGLPAGVPTLPPGPPGLPTSPITLPGFPDDGGGGGSTSEFGANYGLAAISAQSAYGIPITGAGVTVAVIDSGIDTDHPDLDAQINADSIRVNGGAVQPAQSFQDTDGHGSAVASIIAGERNGVGTHGVAYDAEIMAIRAETAGSCTPSCSYTEQNLVAAVQHAYTNGADIINLSLGGDVVFPTFEQELENAVAAGALIVLSSGNDGLSRPFLSAQAAARPGMNGGAIIAGAVDQNNQVASFNNDAGTFDEVYLVAPGVNIPSANESGGFEGVSGTSFSAPHISGAAALILQADPTLTPSQVATILFNSATDLGDEAVYGQGLVNIDAALRAQGSLSVAGTGGGAVAPLPGSQISLGPAFGTAATNFRDLGEMVVLDAFGRPYFAPIGDQTIEQGSTFSLIDRLESRNEQQISKTVEEGSTRMFASLDDTVNSPVWLTEPEADKGRNPDRAVSTSLVQGLGGGQAVGFAMGRSLANELGDSVGGEAVTGSFLAPSFTEETAVGDGQDHREVGFSKRFGGGWSASWRVAQETGGGMEGRTLPQALREDAETLTVSSRITHRGARTAVSLGVDVQAEDGSVLDSRSSGALALGESANTVSLTLDLERKIGAWTAFAEGAYGVTQVAESGASLINSVGTLETSRFRIGTFRGDLLMAGDVMGLGIAQPLRVENGTAGFNQTVAWDFNTDAPLTVAQQVALNPSGRALDLEMFYRLGLAQTPLSPVVGDLAAVEFNILHQLEPGHDGQADPETHALVRFTNKF